MSRIYVACLASYNNGVLHGEWIDADEGVDHIHEEIAKILRTSKYPNVEIECPSCVGRGERVIGHNSETGDTRMGPCEDCKGTGKVASAEEWAIHDFEGFAGIKLSESHDLDDVAALAELIAEHDEDLVQAASDHTSEHDADSIRSVIEDQYRGTFDSEEDYAVSLIADCYSLKDIPDIIANHIDYEGIARDLQMGGDCSFVRVNGAVYVFDNN